MRKVVVRSKGVELVDVPEPLMGPGEVLVKVHYSLISSGTERGAVAARSGGLPKKLQKKPSLVLKALDKLIRGQALASYRKIKEKSSEPKPLGYSLAGTVLAVGERVKGLSPGTRVACGGTQSAHHAEVVSVPGALCVPVPQGCDLRDAAFVSVGAVAVHALRRAKLGFGEGVLIIGTGLVGALAARVAQLSGFRVLGVERDPARAKMLGKLGIECVGPDDVQGAVARAFGGSGADAVLVCVSGGGREVLDVALDAARPGARVVLVGNTEVSADRAKMYPKELELVMATSYGPGRYDPVYEEKGVDYPIKFVRWTEGRNMEFFLGLAASGRFSPFRELGAETVDVSRAPEAYHKLSGPSPPVAVLFSYQQDKVLAEPRETRLRLGGKIGVALVGPGRFAREKHLGALQRSGDFELLRVVSRSPERALAAAERFGATPSSLEDALADPQVNLVFITTRHDSHPALVRQSLDAGKPVFVEKPLALRPEELEEVIQAQKRAQLPVVVGFNRRYSRLSEELRGFVAENRPATVLYRVNAGPLPGDHWLLDPGVGGGRLRGEGCHFLDYLVFLLGQDFSLVDAAGNDDEFTAWVAWPDGSAGTLIYSGRGSRDLPKERIEVFAGGRAAVLDDFTSLSILGEEPRHIALPRQDKGFSRQLELLANLMRGPGPGPVDFSEAVSSTLLTLAAWEALRAEHA